jgi:hypothetical protein
LRWVPGGWPRIRVTRRRFAPWARRLERLYPGAIEERGARAMVYDLHALIAEGERLDIVAVQLKGNRVRA